MHQTGPALFSLSLCEQILAFRNPAFKNLSNNPWGFLYQVCLVAVCVPVSQGAHTACVQLGWSHLIRIPLYLMVCMLQPYSTVNTGGGAFSLQNPSFGIDRTAECAKNKCAEVM